MHDALERTSAPPDQAAEHGVRMLATLGALLGFASISTDLYLPAMPTIAQSLASRAGEVEWTISGYLVGFSLGQLFWGPVGDRFGRRFPVLIGLGLFMVGSAGCAVSENITAIIISRLVQAAGASAGVVLARAMVRDLYEGNRAARMMSTLMTIMAIAPLIGPIIGAQVLAMAGWRAIFWTLVGVGFVSLLAVATMPETLPHHRRTQMPISATFAGYLDLVRDRKLIGYMAVGGFFYAGSFAGVAGTPAAYISYHHVPTAMYGLLFGSGILGIMGANLISARLVERICTDQLMLVGCLTAAAAGTLAAIASVTDAFGLAGLAVPMFAYVTATGFIIANSISGALARFPLRAGSASALLGAVQYGGGIIGSALVGLFADGTPAALGIILAVSGIGSCLCGVLLVRASSDEPPIPEGT